MEFPTLACGELVESVEAGTRGISVKYEPLGNRVYKSSSAQGTRKYIVDISGHLRTILLEIDTSDSSLTKTCTYANGQVLAQHDGQAYYPVAARYFYPHDRLGSVREIINVNGALVEHHTYGPFGQTIEESSAGSQAPTNVFLFTG